MIFPSLPIGVTAQAQTVRAHLKRIMEVIGRTHLSWNRLMVGTTALILRQSLHASWTNFYQGEVVGIGAVRLNMIHSRTWGQQKRRGLNGRKNWRRWSRSAPLFQGPGK